MTANKIQRWIDLLATLLARRLPATFTELARDVPDYLHDGSVLAGQPSPTLKRMFERDKLELREQGVPIESIGEEGSDNLAYALRHKDFYLPYLGVVSARGLAQPEKEVWRRRISGSVPRNPSVASCRGCHYEPESIVGILNAGRASHEQE